MSSPNGRARSPDGGRKLDTLDFKEAGVIGIAQSTALIAGISRDGMCMAAGLVRGLDNSDAARYAFLLATPPILLAGSLKFGDLTGRSATTESAVRPCIAAIAVGDHGRVHRSLSHALVQDASTLKPFGIYCIVFGCRDGHLQPLSTRGSRARRRRRASRAPASAEADLAVGTRPRLRAIDELQALRIAALQQPREQRHAAHSRSAGPADPCFASSPNSTVAAIS